MIQTIWVHMQMALANLSMAKLRTGLAMLGILVGTASVVAMVSIGQLATLAALAQFKTLGTDLLAVSFYPERSAQGSGGSAGMNVSPQANLDAAQFLELKYRVPEINQIAPYTSSYATILFGDQTLQGNIIGANDALALVLRLKMDQGRFISFLDHQEFFCVIGHGIYEKIRANGSHEVLGKQLTLGNTIFTVIGILAPAPENMFFNYPLNDAIIIPLSSTYFIDPEVRIHDIVMRLKEHTELSTVQAVIHNNLALQMPGYNILFRSPQEIIDSMHKQHAIFTLLLGSIGGIALLVGGIGVMNIMLVSVLERRREIGIRMAIGARRRDILWLFLMESIILSWLGGLFGILLGTSVSWVVAWLSAWPFAIFFVPVSIGFVVSVIVGIFFGLYPAYQAAKLDPIETLRSE